VSVVGDSNEKLLPGTAAYSPDFGERGFAKIEMLLEATGGLSLSQVCAVTGLEGSTIQNWVKRGWVSHPTGKKYEEVHIARILIINALKECIKLEHIALLMSYVNTSVQEKGGAIKESELYDFLNDALGRMGKAQDHSRGGIEKVVDTVIKGYTGPDPESRVRIRKALTLMIYACVCTDVKRRTEAMMRQILHDLEHPGGAETEEGDIAEETISNDSASETVGVVESRKTIAQTLREWDISSVERVIIDHSDMSSNGQTADDPEKTVSRPWYSRKGPK